MHEAKQKDFREFNHFNEFFTRELEPASRPISDHICISPVDGSISQFGSIDRQTLVQAKGQQYTLDQLFAGNAEIASLFNQGCFITLYLSPGDYHRIHMPVDGRLLKTLYVPGQLFSVNTRSTRIVKNLFTRNERIINLFETAYGPMVLVMVGAIFVSSMQTDWQGVITPTENFKTDSYDYASHGESYLYNKGDDIARFNMGSTVILLFAKGAFEWRKDLINGSAIKTGMALSAN